MDESILHLFAPFASELKALQSIENLINMLFKLSRWSFHESSHRHRELIMNAIKSKLFEDSSKKMMFIKMTEEKFPKLRDQPRILNSLANSFVLRSLLISSCCSLIAYKESAVL